MVVQEVGEFSECIEAMKELLTLKETEQVDVPALSLLIKYVMQDLINGTTPAGALVHQQLSAFMSEGTINPNFHFPLIRGVVRYLS